MDFFDPKYGNFGPLVAIAGALMATAQTIIFLWAGAAKNWRPPDAHLPKTGKRIVLVLIVAIVVILFPFSKPEYMNYFLMLIGISAFLTLVLYLKYSSISGLYRFKKMVAIDLVGKYEQIEIFGGSKLTPEAEKIKIKKGYTEQELFENCGYKEDKIWERRDRQKVIDQALLLFVCMLVFGSVVLASSSYAIQTYVTDKDAKDVKTKSDLEQQSSAEN